jgi:hypothetical protein
MLSDPLSNQLLKLVIDFGLLTCQTGLKLRPLTRLIVLSFRLLKRQRGKFHAENQHSSGPLLMASVLERVSKMAGESWSQSRRG